MQETTVAGSHTESGVKALVFDNNQTAFVTLYRNPAKASGITFSIQNYTGSSVTATLTNLQGKVVAKQSYTVASSASSHTLVV